MYEEDVHFQVICREEIADDLAQIQESFGCNVKTGPKSTKPLKTGDAMLTDLRFTLEYGPADRNNTARRFKGHRLVSNLQSTRKPPGLNGNGKIRTFSFFRTKRFRALLRQLQLPVDRHDTWTAALSIHVNPSMAFLASQLWLAPQSGAQECIMFSAGLQAHHCNLSGLLCPAWLRFLGWNIWNSERIGSIQTLQLGYCVLFQSEVQTCVQRAFSCCNCSNVHEDYEEWQNKGDSSFNWAMAASLRLRGYHITPRLGLTWGFETLG